MQAVGENIYVLVFYSALGVLLLVGGFLLLTVKNQNRLLKQKRKLQEAELVHQKAMLHAVIRSQEEERRRIGRDLHDEIGGGLAALRLNLNALLAGKNEAAPGKEPYKEMIDNLIREVRNISHNLSPPGLAIFGLPGALEQLLTNLNNAGNLSATATFDAPETLQQLTEQEALGIYRVVQELISNTLKHAAASHITLTQKQLENAMQLTYSDNGQGCNLTDLRTGMGLSNIESRLEMIRATYEVFSEPGKGFSMSINLAVSFQP